MYCHCRQKRLWKKYFIALVSPLGAAHRWRSIHPERRHCPDDVSRRAPAPLEDSLAKCHVRFKARPETKGAGSDQKRSARRQRKWVATGIIRWTETTRRFGPYPCPLSSCLAFRWTVRSTWRTNKTWNAAINRKIWLQRGFSVVLVTHDIDEAVTLADRVYVIENGSIANTYDINLPRPRKRSSYEFVETAEEILNRVLGVNATNGHLVSLSNIK